MRTSTAKGWGVRKEGKYVRLEVRGTGSVCLPFLWERGSVGDVQQRVRNIYALVGAGHTLKDAAERADTASASSSSRRLASSPAGLAEEAAAAAAATARRR